MAVSSASMAKNFQAGASSMPALCAKPVSVAPGRTAVAVMPVCLSSEASAVVNDSTNVLAAPYSAL